LSESFNSLAAFIGHNVLVLLQAERVVLIKPLKAMLSKEKKVQECDATDGS
jgi:hypothetical protein